MKKYNLIITPRAENSIERVMDYLLETWGESSLHKFVKELNRNFYIMENNPFSFPLSIKHNNIRRCVVTPLNIVYYTIIDDDVVILSLEDTRMDPSCSNSFQPSVGNHPVEAHGSDRNIILH